LFLQVILALAPELAWFHTSTVRRLETLSSAINSSCNTKSR
jgi:hypothetical protein